MSVRVPYNKFVWLKVSFLINWNVIEVEKNHLSGINRFGRTNSIWYYKFWFNLGLFWFYLSIIYNSNDDGVYIGVKTLKLSVAVITVVKQKKKWSWQIISQWKFNEFLKFHNKIKKTVEHKLNDSACNHVVSSRNHLCHVFGSKSTSTFSISILKY